MKPFFFSLVMLIASPAWAGWEEVTRGSSSGNVFYIDPATIRKEGNRRKVWAITDLNKAGSLGELSIKIRKEVCFFGYENWSDSLFYGVANHR